MKSYKLLFVLLCYFFLDKNVLYAQYLQHKFERITVKEGLSGSTVYHTIQDKTGFIWFATSNGVSKFDGYNFTNFHHDPDNPNSLSQSTCIHLFEDTEGQIWVINNGNTGLDRYNPEYGTFKNFRNVPDNENSLSSNNIYYILQDNDDNIWICAEDALNLVVIKKDSVSFQRYYYPEDMVDYVGRAHINKDGVFILFSTKVYYFDRKTHEFTPAGINLVTKQFNSIAADKNEDIYLGTISAGIIKLSYNSNTKLYSLVQDYKFNPVSDKRTYVSIDDKNQLWLGTETKGLYKYNPATDDTLHFMNDEMDDFSLSDNSVHSIFIDRTGIMWIGTLSQGICKYNLFQKPFYHYRSIKNNPNSLSGNIMSSLHSISAYELWAGNRGDAGVNRIIFDNENNPRFVHYKHDPDNPNSIASNNVLCLVQRRNGEVWIGSGSIQVSKIIPEEQFANEEPIIENYNNNSWTFTIFEDSDGTLWGGTWGAGLWRLNDFNNSFTYFTHNPDNPSSICDNMVWAIYEDSEKNLWIGGNQNGISILPADQKNSTNPEFIHFNYDKENPLSLSSNMINAFYQDKKGTMWIATNGGINQVINSKNSLKTFIQTKQLEFKSFEMKDGLPSDGIVGIADDKDSNLWVSTSNGISYFNLKDSTFINYYESDGLQSDEFWHNSYFVNSKGRMFFGGKNGITAFYPEEIQANPIIPQIVFTDLKIFNKTVKIGETVNNDVVLPKSINDLSEIVLSRKNNVFTIEFAALHYTQPYKNQYAYYLENFEDDWNYVDNIRSATYTNLNPGKYIFRVKGSNNNGLWNEDGRSIIIRIKAPWWSTWIFRIILFIIIVLIVSIGIRMRMDAIKQEKELLQQKIDQDEKELQKRKDEIEKQKQEIEEQSRKEYEINYLHSGISKFTELITEERKDINKLSRTIIKELVKYAEASAGIIYLIKDVDNENIILTNAGSYCFDSDTIKDKEFQPGEGYIGTCFSEKKFMEINNLPDGYAVLRSSLGDTSLKHSVFAPIVNEDICLGVIEVASLNAIEAYKIEFISKLADNFASIITVSFANEKMQKMLEQNRIQAEELKSQEEELRQNLEEMAATQEDLKHQIETTEKAQEKMLFEQSLTNSLLENAEESIYFKDLQSRFLKASKSMKSVFNVKKVEDIYGKTDFDFFTEEHARPAFEDEQMIIKTGKPVFNKIEKETHNDGRITYVTTSKMPLKNTEGKIIGTFGISKNITELYTLKDKIGGLEKEMEEKYDEITNLQDLLLEKDVLIKELEKKLNS